MLNLFIILCSIQNLVITPVYSAPTPSENELVHRFNESELSPVFNASELSANVTSLNLKLLSLKENNGIINSTEADILTHFDPVTILLIQGDCDESVRRPRFYTENFFLENDGKSQVNASMKIQVSGSPNITCIEIVSRSNDKTRPYITSGGVGSSYVDVGVLAEYGKGFDFSVNLFGSFFSDGKE